MVKKNILFLFGGMGYGGDLLYWSHLIKRVISEYGCLTIKLLNKQKPFCSSILGLDVKYSKGKFFDFFELLRWFFLRKNSLVVVNEFGFGLLVCFLSKLLGCRINVAVLVENHPRFLFNFYKKNRTGFFYKKIRKILLRGADFVFANTILAEEYLISDLNFPREKIVQFCYLTSSASSGCAEISHKKTEGKIKFVFVGRLVEGKGVQNIIKALSLIPNEIKSKLLFDIIGDGEYKACLEDACAATNLAQYFRFHGYVKYGEVGSYLEAADVAIFPTFGDYRSLFNFEALSVGLPIIGSIFDGAISEVVIDGLNGFSVDPHDFKALAEKIMFFAENPESIHSFSEKSKILYTAYSQKRVSDNFVAGIKIAINGHA